MRNTIVRGLLMNVIYPEKNFFADQRLVFAFHHLSFQQPMCQDTAIERTLKNLRQLLLIHGHTQCLEPLDDLFVLHAFRLPLKGFSDLPAFGIDDDLPF
nr:hypothetical protein [Puia dinghuensis]